MIDSPAQNSKLPQLRSELSVHQAPEAQDGSPTWTIHDPVRNLYFQIDWMTFEILCRWHLGNVDLVVQSVSEDTLLVLDNDSVGQVIEFLNENELLASSDPQTTELFVKKEARRKQSWMKRLLHAYLFFRVPLVKPDRVVQNLLPFLAWLGGNGFKLVTLIVLVFGLVQVSQQWEQFTGSLVDMFSVSGFIAYAVTLVFVKVIHEFGHAFTAKHFGCRVPTMGVAFLVMFPMAYTDVNDVWRLREKRKRLWVGSAGILTELSLAVWATLAWTMLPDGPIRTSMFLIATTTWISTLLVNASPFLRFDGYFLLMDWLEINNLHAKSFALSRWKLREWLFGLNEEKPESLSQSKERFLIFFGFFTWLYRLIVFVGIAILVYWMFPKPLGPILAWIELYWFIIKPALSEFKVWIEKRGKILSSVRTFVTALSIAILIIIAAVPWDPRVNLVGVLKPKELQIISLPEPAALSEVLVQDGQKVTVGDVIARFDSPDLQFEVEAAKTKLARIEWLIGNQSMNSNIRERVLVLQAERKQALSELKSLEQKVSDLELRAKESGVVRWLVFDLNIDDWLDKREPVVQVQSVTEYDVFAYVSHQDLSRLSVGDSAKFFAESNAVEPIPVTVDSIDLDATRSIKYPYLSSVLGGPILARQSGDSIIPESAIYNVRFTIDNTAVLTDLPLISGTITTYGQPQSWLRPYWVSAGAVLRRELGF